MSNIRIEVFRRIVLAKSLHSAGVSACSVQNDQMSFTKGILLLHDSVESALGAVADHLDAKLTGNRYLLDYYDLIEDADSNKRSVPYRTQMRNLNTLRNITKHQGILPDPHSNAHFPTTVQALLEEVSQTYFGIDYSTVSLKSLIRNQTIREYIDEAEKDIEQGSFETALINLSYAMYHICDYSASDALLSAFLSIKKEEEQLYKFPKTYTVEHTVNLLEHGVDPYLYQRFKNLTPRIGKHRDTGDLHYWWEKHFGHPANWTKLNAVFCLNYCIETALKFQRDVDEGFSLVYYYEIYEDVIEPKGEEAIIWNQSSHPEVYIRKPQIPRTPVMVLKKGQSIVGQAHDYENRLDEWSIMSEDIPSPSGGIGFGVVIKNEVIVTRREKQEPKQIENEADNQEKETQDS